MTKLAWLATLLLVCGGCGGDDSGGGDLGADARPADPDAAPAPDATPSPDAPPPDAAPSCTDLVQNGDETDVDCGGAVCDPCVTGRACLTPGDCVASVCVASVCEDHHRTCVQVAAAFPEGQGGVFTIDPDGAAASAEPRDVYCVINSAQGGGWQLVSALVPAANPTIFTPGGAPLTPFLGSASCTNPGERCFGHIDPTQVSASGEVAIVSTSEADGYPYLVLHGFSGGADSALRYFSLEKTLSVSSSCDAPHTCMNTTMDPALDVKATSGYPMVTPEPLVQWWRLGGWYVGTGALAGDYAGSIFATFYNGTNYLSSRPEGQPSTPFVGGGQLVFYRQPAP